MKKVTLSLPADTLREADQEAKRLDRGLSWVMARAWLHARAKLRAMPVEENADARVQ